MREIKFRAWFKPNKTMYQVGQVTLEKGTWTYEPDNKENVGVCVPYQPSFILMQYTGLKDKNGKEIYEGDIIKTHFIGGDGVENDEVIFDRGCFCVNYSEDYHPLLNEVNHCSEVIGNIYNNPELLEKG